METIYCRKIGNELAEWLPLRLLGWVAQALDAPKSASHKMVGPCAVVEDAEGKIFFLHSKEYEFKTRESA